MAQVTLPMARSPRTGGLSWKPGAETCLCLSLSPPGFPSGCTQSARLFDHDAQQGYILHHNALCMFSQNCIVLLFFLMLTCFQNLLTVYNLKSKNSELRSFIPHNPY